MKKVGRPLLRESEIFDMIHVLRRIGFVHSLDFGECPKQSK
jgi:hypothetical protein